MERSLRTNKVINWDEISQDSGKSLGIEGFYLDYQRGNVLFIHYFMSVISDKGFLISRKREIIDNRSIWV